mmetsp:Transcript_11409/g.38909  ORF Transcript_11409/g.38909 Transcript_11409/m.38909 type:complete len:202 (-) Transcript_11409:224-829(-)
MPRRTSRPSRGSTRSPRASALPPSLRRRRSSALTSMSRRSWTAPTQSARPPSWSTGASWTSWPSASWRRKRWTGPSSTSSSHRTRRCRAARSSRSAARRSSRPPPRWRRRPPPRGRPERRDRVLGSRDSARAPRAAAQCAGVGVARRLSCALEGRGGHDGSPARGPDTASDLATRVQCAAVCWRRQAWAGGPRPCTATGKL